jgi:hypothetical protein
VGYHWSERELVRFTGDNRRAGDSAIDDGGVGSRDAGQARTTGRNGDTTGLG